jgi:hypothetical protein
MKWQKIGIDYCYRIIISYKMAFQHIIHNNNLTKNIRQIKNTNNKK